MKPRLALVIADTDQHVLAAQALLHTLRGVDPAQVLVFSDRSDAWPGGCELVRIDPIRRMETYNQLITRDLAEHLRADHVLVIQYDGFLLHPSSFEPEFLRQDYIGAPWPQFVHDQVGNGGFSLRSRRLVDAVAALPYGDPREPEDVFICRSSRSALEACGLCFAPLDMARRFSVEWPPVAHPTWGFHGVFHLPVVYRQHLDFLIDHLPDRTLASRAPYLLPFLEALSASAARRVRQRLAQAQAPHPEPTVEVTHE
jgi:Protein of unknown function (DUF5672)